MMNHSLKSQCSVSPGTIIEGKWHRNRYKILKQLGFGANGVVYLAQYKNQHVALKMSDNGMSITSEVNVLKSFAKVQGSALGPSLLDVDDWQKSTGNISFYVMEYLEGRDFLSFLGHKGKSWTSVLLLQLLSDLDKLHQNGWIFGDLKPENLIVTGPPPRIRCIDVGGTTIQGRAIKEFTEFYDRGYWGLGSRKADPGYDLFALAMVMINTAYPNRFQKTTGGFTQLSAAIRQKPELKPYEGIILKALQGHYTHASQMRSDLVALMNPKPAARVAPATKQTNASRVQRNHTAAQVTNNQTRTTVVQKKKKGGFAETLLIVAIISLFYALYIFGQVL
ncbi:MULTISPECIES: serine/threonine-protein kinase [unclassified Bacillus (in: firmicutes)]|uniref:protein kinase domain-containing protein n=1 Tax=unclassified Bacillus (in: firmicutes) TaxID=185979 RepID=UPI000B8052C6|nr:MULTISPECIES: serine/threonine-protein kinase [unclassified Bacillus (in: firmicutes)]